MFASSGEALPPCGVPCSTCIRCPSSSTPAFSHFWMSRTTRRSAIRCSTNLTSHPWSMESKKAADVHLEHPVHLLGQHSGVERIQRMMRAAPGPEAVREAEEVGLVDGIQHLDRGALEQLIFQRRHPERPLPPVGLGDVHPPYRLGPIRSTLDPVGEVAEVLLQPLAVVPPSLAVHPCSRFSLEVEVSNSQCWQRVDMVQERGEPHLPIPGCCQAYPLQRTGRA